VLGTIYVFILAFYTYSLYVSGNKVRVVPVHTINTYRSGGIAPRILNFSTTFSSCFSHRRKSPWSALDRRLGCLQRQARSYGEEKLFDPQRIELLFLDFLACILATTLSYHIVSEHAVR
jgi:hypothetical protein